MVEISIFSTVLKTHWQDKQKRRFSDTENKFRRKRSEKHVYTHSRFEKFYVFHSTSTCTWNFRNFLKVLKRSWLGGKSVGRHRERVPTGKGQKVRLNTFLVRKTLTFFTLTRRVVGIFEIFWRFWKGLNKAKNPSEDTENEIRREKVEKHV